MFLSERRKGADNLIEQLRRSGKGVRVLGDDTWGRLFDLRSGGKGEEEERDNKGENNKSENQS